LSCFEIILDIVPNHFEALFGKGRILSSQKQYLESIVWFDKALKTDPENDLALIQKGQSLSYLEDYHNAMRCYDGAIKMLNKRRVFIGAYYDPWYGLGFCYAKLEEFKKAIKWFDTLLKYEPNDIDAKNSKDLAEKLLKETKKKRFWKF